MSHYHTSEEKPRLQIQEDRVLCLLFYKRKRRQRGGMQLYSGAADDLSPLYTALTEAQWPPVANTENWECIWPLKCIYELK